MFQELIIGIDEVASTIINHNHQQSFDANLRGARATIHHLLQFCRRQPQNTNDRRRVTQSRR
jgi:hypothetical protein